MKVNTIHIIIRCNTKCWSIVAATCDLSEWHCHSPRRVSRDCERIAAIAREWNRNLKLLDYDSHWTPVRNKRAHNLPGLDHTRLSINVSIDREQISSATVPFNVQPENWKKGREKCVVPHTRLDDTTHRGFASQWFCQRDILHLSSNAARHN